MDRCWILVGMMGSGKTAIGREVASISGREFLDTDQALQLRLGRSPQQVFAINGEQAFREHESALLRELKPSKAVLSTGGGIVLREENWREMRRLGITAYLRVEPDILERRLRESRRKRPLLATEEWEDRLRQIYAERVSLYEQADIVLDVGTLNVRPTAIGVHQAFVRFESHETPRSSLKEAL
jgi:shikimate kinase